MTRINDTLGGKFAAWTLAGATLLATFSGSALGANDAERCIPPNDPVAGQAYTLQQAAAISASRGGRVVLFVNKENLWTAQGGAEVLNADGIRTAAVEAAPGELEQGKVRMIIAGAAPKTSIYPADDLYNGAVGGKAEIFFTKLQKATNPKTGAPYIAAVDPSCETVALAPN